uniref:CDC23 (cell division cycle 23, yeast, homolog) n=1 Tax=Cyprinus carpio TaxID=7962 RepID=A0A8C1KJ12_CYPCA
SITAVCSRATELAFSLDPLPLNEIPPAPEDPCVCVCVSQLKSLSLPECWVRDFFMAHMFTELQKYQSLMEAGFTKSTYIISQSAVAYHNIRAEEKTSYFSETLYLHAIEVNKRDYRAWYGLGQTYGILKMPFYSLYYYSVCVCVCVCDGFRPNDSRMLVALGECYRNCLSRWRVYSVGDVERMALLKLAKLHEQLNESDDAAQCYIIYIRDIFSCGEQLEHAEVSTALRYLGQYYFKNRLYDEAVTCLTRFKCLFQAREEGKALLRRISAVREQGEQSLPCVFNPLSNTTTPVSPRPVLHHTL